jgi:hypothetical protein
MFGDFGTFDADLAVETNKEQPPFRSVVKMRVGNRLPINPIQELSIVLPMPGA